MNYESRAISKWSCPPVVGILSCAPPTWAAAGPTSSPVSGVPDWLAFRNTFDPGAPGLSPNCPMYLVASTGGENSRPAGFVTATLALTAVAFGHSRVAIARAAY